MAYTTFRKSYGDFEVVIPAVDFSPLAIGEAYNAARAWLGLRDHAERKEGWGFCIVRRPVA